jgi:hypothetical protein
MAVDFIYSIDPSAQPKVDEDFLGVVVSSPEQVSVVGEWKINGLFQMAGADLEAIDTQPHRALVVVCSLADGWYADSPLRSKIFFPDDLHAAGNLVRGYFSFELFSLLQDRVPGNYTLSVSLGEHLSESLRVEVR